MSAQARPQAWRGPSGAWSRLKPPPSDPLQMYSLPSKGETRLKDPKLQEQFYAKIVERYMKFCAASGSDLERQFAALSLTPDPSSSPPNSNALLNDDAASQPSSISTILPSSRPAAPPEQSQELQTILLAMRKLREAIVAIRRRDLFAQRCYVFIVRVAVLASAWEAYMPALTYLLSEIQPVTPLDASELNELVILQILDHACRIGDLHTAHLIRIDWGIADRRVAGILQSLARDDWLQFWRIRKKVDGYQRAVMGFAEGGIRLRALKCLGKTYFTVEKQFVETVAGQDWEKLVAGGVGWELAAGDSVVIRRAKSK